MLWKWDLAQILAGSLGLKFFNVQLMHKIHSLSLPRLVSLELSRWESFFMTVVSWVTWWPGLYPHSSLCRCSCPNHHHSSALFAESPNRVPTVLGYSAGYSSFLEPQRHSLGHVQHLIPLVSLGKIWEEIGCF